MTRQPHPPGLYVLFFTEMWERFSFYVMNALFVLYMTWEDNGHPFLQKYSAIIYGAYVGTVYFTPFFGGILADGPLGYRWAVMQGAVIMGLGHVLLGFDHIAFFFAGLIALTLGNGLFKPNISVLVGKLYPANDPRLDNAYTIFYMGINVGAFIAPIIAGLVRVRYGFHTAFAIAGIGMGISLVTFVVFGKYLSFTRGDEAMKAARQEEEVSPETQRLRNVALLIIFVIVALFWMAFKQGGVTIPQWFRDNTDRTAPSWLPEGLLDKKGEITTEYFSSLNPFYVITLSIPLAWFWLWLRSKDSEPSTPAKIGIGMLLSALGFGLLAFSAFIGADEGYLVSPWYLLVAYLLITTAELCLSPIGLSLVSKLASPKHRSTWMGGWFAATAIGGYLSGLIGHFWKRVPYSTFFGILVLASLTAAGVLFAFYGLLRRAMPAPRRTVSLPPPASTNPTSITASAP